MSPHTDAGALLKLVELRKNLAGNITLLSHHKSMILQLVDEKIAALRQAASHGSAGGEPLDEVYKRAWDAYVEFSMAPDHTTFDCIRAVVDAILSPPVKTGDPQ